MLAISERPSFWTIVGGTIVLSTSLARSVVASRPHELQGLRKRSRLDNL
jgi:hypothetical protein